MPVTSQKFLLKAVSASHEATINSCSRSHLEESLLAIRQLARVVDRETSKR
jgi:hypothetical protein